MDFQDLVLTGIGDWSIEAIHWEEDSVLRMVFADTMDQEVSVRFTWVTELSINLQYGKYAGQPLLYDASLRKTDMGIWELTFVLETQPTGHITFKYNKADVEIL